MKHCGFLLLLSTFLFSCGSDDDTPQGPNVIGTYMIDSARDECPNSADNVMVDNIGEGICIGSTCTSITQTFASDNTYTFLQIDEIESGGIISSQRTEEEGSYMISGSTLTTTSTDGSVNRQTIVNDGLFLDLLAAQTSSGCDRILRFGR